MADTTWHKITLIGFGSQGRAWAENLRDSERYVSCFLREGSPKKKAVEKANLFLLNSAHELSKSNVLLLLIPDHAHLDFLKEHADFILPGTTLIYGHGASVVEHDLISTFPQWNHILLAPKAIASEVRQAKHQGGGIGAVYSLEGVKENEREKFRPLLLNLAKDLGISAGPFEVTFAQEARADLLSEQSLLCGLIPYAAKACFEKLVAQGIPPELAYLEAWHEVKLIGTAMANKGPVGFYELISPHALVGGQLASEKIFDKNQQETLQQLSDEIWSGEFFSKIKEINFAEQRKIEIDKWINHPIQKTFEKLQGDLSPKGN